MGQIKDIIDKGYREIADRLISRKKHKEHFDDSTAPNSDNLTHHVSGFDDCNDIFYRMLEAVGKRAELGITHESLFKFFGGHAFIDFGSIDTDGDVPARLLEAVDHRRIASILYYAKHHKSYDEELERAYSEAIGELLAGISEPETFFAITIRQNVDDFTHRIIEDAAERVYNEIYNNQNLNPKYKMDKNTFDKNISDQSWAYSESTKLHTTSYAQRIENKIRTAQYISVETCHAKSEVPKSRKFFFQKTITALAGFNFSEFADNNLVGQEFILVTMEKDVVETMNAWCKLMKGKAPYLVEIDPQENLNNNIIYEKITIGKINKYVTDDRAMKLLFTTRSLFFQILIAKKPHCPIYRLTSYSL